jgi:hypothetical protein
MNQVTRIRAARAMHDGGMAVAVIAERFGTNAQTVRFWIGLDGLAPSNLTPKAIARFMKQVGPVEDSGCRLWRGARSVRGYGRFTIGDREFGAHRVSWVIENGRPVPPGDVVCHTCDTPACVEPRHLWAGSQRDNVLDARDKGRLRRRARASSWRRRSEVRTVLMEDYARARPSDSA